MALTKWERDRDRKKDKKLEEEKKNNGMSHLFRLPYSTHTKWSWIRLMFDDINALKGTCTSASYLALLLLLILLLSFYFVILFFALSFRFVSLFIETVCKVVKLHLVKIVILYMFRCVCICIPYTFKIACVCECVIKRFESLNHISFSNSYGYFIFICLYFKRHPPKCIELQTIYSVCYFSCIGLASFR